MKLGIIAVASVVMAAGVFCPDAMANQTGVLNLDQVAPYYYDVGGEFTAYVTSGPQFVQNYSPLATASGGFDTFCIEVEVDFNPGSSFNFALNPSQSADGTTLSKGAAYLYYEFATGQLSGYNYANPSAVVPSLGYSDDAELQAAIWWFQGNQQYGDGAYPVGANNYYYQLALSNLGLNSITAETPENGQFGVEALVLTNPDGSPAQNQLVYVGIPDKSGTWAMLLLGLAGLAAFARAADRFGARKPALQPCRVSAKRNPPAQIR